METWRNGGFGVYVHWPFCAAKCPYCDFNSHVVSQVDQARWLRAFEAEIAYWGERLGHRRPTRSVFFGGGTPSLMQPFVVDGILSALRKHLQFDNGVEITLEANPTSVEAGRFRDFVGAGINRFSVGLQALNDADLKRLGRLHSAAEGRAAYDTARSICDRVSFDLIYARQDQTAEQWRSELTEAVAMGPDHLSLYQLTIEAGTAFGDRAARGKLRGLPDEDMSVEMWDITQEVTIAGGLDRYETSSHARPGAESRHNLIYWQGGEWLGVGPGAHGRVSVDGIRRATQTFLAPGRWIQDVEAHGHGLEVDDTLQPSDNIDEYVISALRVRAGIDLEHVKTLGGEIPEDRIAPLVDDGLLERAESHVRATERGALLLNSVALALVAG